MNDMVDMNALRVPPHARHAEQSVLGSVMLDNRAWVRIADQVTEQDFYHQEHQTIFRALTLLAESRQPMDIVTLAESLDRRGELEEAGGLQYLGTIAKETPTAANVGAYARLIREKSMMRRLISVGTDIVDLGWNNAKSVQEAVDKAQSLAMTLDARQEADAMSAKDYMARVVASIDRRSAGQEFGISTGFPDIDRLTTGLHPGKLILIAARPGMGKSALGMDIVRNAGLKGRRSKVFTLEMPGDELMERQPAALSGITYQNIRTGKLTDGEWPMLTEATSTLSGLDIEIDETPGLSIKQLRSRARKAHQRKPLDIVLVDYLQLVHGEGDNRTREIGSISRGLKELAKELSIPVIAISQLSRRLEDRRNRRPMLSDLRESGELEQDADLVMLLYRDEVYNEDTQDKGVAEVNIAKQRGGPTGSVKLTWQGQYIRFQSYVEQWGTPEPRQAKNQDYLDL